MYSWRRQFFFLKLLFNEKIYIIPEPYGIYHTEASDLFGCGYKTIPPIQPYFTEAESLIASCPQGKKQILKKFLSLRALQMAIMYSKLGQKKIAVNLLDRFCSHENLNTKQILKARLLSNLAPILPLIRRFWRLRTMINIRKLSS